MWATTKNILDPHEVDDDINTKHFMSLNALIQKIMNV